MAKKAKRKMTKTQQKYYDLGRESVFSKNICIMRESADKIILK